MLFRSVSQSRYHVNVEVEYEDVSYEEIVPKLVSFAVQKDEESKPEPVKKSEPEMTEEARTVILEVLNLMNTNVQHCNTAKLIRLVDVTWDDKDDGKIYYKWFMITQIRDHYAMFELY